MENNDERIATLRGEFSLVIERFEDLNGIQVYTMTPINLILDSKIELASLYFVENKHLHKTLLTDPKPEEERKIEDYGYYALFLN